MKKDFIKPALGGLEKSHLLHDGISEVPKPPELLLKGEIMLKNDDPRLVCLLCGRKKITPAAQELDR